jgi:hypothetical protein
MKCPNCGSLNLLVFSQLGLTWCKDCGHLNICGDDYTPEGSKWNTLDIKPDGKSDIIVYDYATGFWVCSTEKRIEFYLQYNCKWQLIVPPKEEK